MRIKNGDWTRLADHVTAARKALDLTQHELVAAGGGSFSLSTLQGVERGTVRTRMPNTIADIERALGWAPGSARAVVLGGDPVVIPAVPVKMSEDALRVRRDLYSLPKHERDQILRELTE